MRSPIGWFGGKGNMTRKLLSLLPAHDKYVEVFGGGASLLFAKRPVSVEVYNDLDYGLVNFFRMLQSPEMFKQFYRRIVFVPYSRREYMDARDWCCGHGGPNADPLEYAFRWYIVARMSFSGSWGASWSSIVTRSINNRAATANKWQTILCELPKIVERLLRVQIEQADWRVILERYSGTGWLAYCDPPYLHETRSEGKYLHEMSSSDHKELIERLLAYDGVVILSGYANDIYSPLERAGWRRYDFKTACHAAGKTRASGAQGKGAALKMQPRTETVWCSQSKGKKTLLGVPVKQL